MTIAEILTALCNAKLDQTAMGLERAIDEEAQALAKLDLYNRRDKGKAAREAACEFYAEDITNQLREPLEPTPDRVLSLRRFPVTWAVAEVLRTNGLAPKEPERKSTLGPWGNGHMPADGSTDK